MITTISQWGNSPAIRIPRHILSQANFKIGTTVEIISPKEGEIILREVGKRKKIREIFANYEEGYFKIKEFEWGEPQGEEVW
jgi:antitoxin MazE